MKKAKIVLLLALLLFLSACGSSAADTTSATDSAADTSETVPEDSGTDGKEASADTAFDEMLYTEAEPTQDAADHSDSLPGIPQVDITSIKDDYYADDGTQLIRYVGLETTVTVPGRPKVEERIQYDLDEALGLTADEQLEAQAEEDYVWAQEEDMDWVAYCDEQSAEVVRADEHVLSLRIDVYSYTGGIHGYYYSYGISYDTETGERLGLKTLSADMTDLPAFLHNTILAMCQEDEYEDRLYEDYKPYISDVIQDSHFYFTDEGITFVAEPYLLGPYAAGQIEFPIPYEELEGVVKDVYLK